MELARNGQRCPGNGDLDEVPLHISEGAQGCGVVSEVTVPMDTGGREGFGQKAIESVDNLP